MHSNSLVVLYYVLVYQMVSLCNTSIVIILKQRVRLCKRYGRGRPGGATVAYNTATQATVI